METKQKHLQCVSDFSDVTGDHLTLLNVFNAFNDIARYGDNHSNNIDDNNSDSNSTNNDNSIGNSVNSSDGTTYCFAFICLESWCLFFLV